MLQNMLPDQAISKKIIANLYKNSSKIWRHFRFDPSKSLIELLKWRQRLLDDIHLVKNRLASYSIDLAPLYYVFGRCFHTISINAAFCNKKLQFWRKCKFTIWRQFRFEVSKFVIEIVNRRQMIIQGKHTIENDRLHYKIDLALFFQKKNIFFQKKAQKINILHQKSEFF